MNWLTDWVSQVGLVVKNPPANAGDLRGLGWIPGSGRSPGGYGNPLQYSCLKNPHGQRSLVGYSPWGWKESHMTEQLSTALNREPILWMFSSLFNLIQGKFHLVSWIWVDSLVLLSGTSVKLLLMNRNNREKKKHAISNCYHFWTPLIMPPNTETVLANFSLWAKSVLPSVFVKQVFLEHGVKFILHIIYVA